MLPTLRIFSDRVVRTCIHSLAFVGSCRIATGALYSATRVLSNRACSRFPAVSLPLSPEPEYEAQHKAAIEALKAVPSHHVSRSLMERLIADEATWRSVSKEWQKLADNKATWDDLATTLLKGNVLDVFFILMRYGLTNEATRAVSMMVSHEAPTFRQLLALRLGQPVPRVSSTFPFDFVAREEQVAIFCQAVLIPCFRLFQSQQTDKSVYASAFIYGQSGMGKSRLSRDLIPQAREYLVQKKEKEGLQKIEAELLEFLHPDRCSTLLIDLRHNGDATVNLNELSEFIPEVILGLRVAARYFGYSVSRVRDMLYSEANGSALRKRFELRSVLHAIADDIASTSASPRVLHLAFDELHFFYKHMVKCTGSSTACAEEPAARAMMRAVMDVCNAYVGPNLFVVGTFAGVVLLPPNHDLLPTDERCLPIHLGGLAVADMHRIVNRHMSELIPADVRNCQWFAKSLLSSLGGLPRALEELVRLPKEGLLKSKTEEPLQAIKRVGTLLADRYHMNSAAELLPYLALSGVPLESLNTPITPPGSKPVTARQLQEAGWTSVMMAPRDEPWVTRWNASSNVMLNMPLALILRAIQSRNYVSSELWTAANKLVNEFTKPPTPEKFESILKLHQHVRALTAWQLATWQGRQTVSARELFCGTDCSPAFTQREFATHSLLTAVAGECPQAENATKQITLQNGTEVAADAVTPVGDRDAVDAVGSDGLQTGGVQRRIDIIMDTKHVGDTCPDEPKDVIEVQYNDDWTCVVNDSDGRLSWSLSPVLAYFFSRD